MSKVLVCNMYVSREDDLNDLDVTVTTRPQHSEPMQMPGITRPNGLMMP